LISDVPNTWFRHRLLTALVVCLSGWILLPFANLPTGLFGWAEFGGVYRIFSDDFEDGSMRRWLDAPGAPHEVQGWLDEGVPFQGRYRIDRERLALTGGRTVPALTGFAVGREVVFATDLREAQGYVEARIGTRRDDGEWLESRWQAIGGDTFRIEWRRAHPQARDGALYLSVHGQLRLWLADLSNAAQELSSTGILEVEGSALLEPLDP
jgi:hypothetical protein